jgi:hypothetical protein
MGTIKILILILLFLSGCCVFIKPEAEVQILKDSSCPEGYVIILKVQGIQKERECSSKQEIDSFLDISEQSDLEDKGNPIEEK